jgi:hypothetical protein
MLSYRVNYLSEWGIIAHAFLSIFCNKFDIFGITWNILEKRSLKDNYTLSTWLIGAPLSNRVFTLSRYPRAAAICNELSPSYKYIGKIIAPKANI